MIEIKEMFSESNDLLKKQILLDSEKLIQSSDYEFPLGTEIKEDGGILYYVGGTNYASDKNSEHHEPRRLKI